MPISLPIFNESYHPSSSWTDEITRKNGLLQKLNPLPDNLVQKLESYLLVQVVTENLLLGDLNITHQRVEELLQDSSIKAEGEVEQAARSFGNAVKRVMQLASTHTSEKPVLVTIELLKELHALTMADLNDEVGGKLRIVEGKSVAPGHTPTNPEILDVLLENALDWFSVESFLELHPVEQAWLVHLRLTELQPFAQANGRIVRLIASLYTLRAGLPPIIVRASDRELYNNALNYSFQMITQPGIELFAGAVSRTLDEMLQIAQPA